MADTPSTNNIGNGLARGVLAASGGAAVAGSHDELIQLLGALATVLSLVWSIWEKLQARKTGAAVASGRAAAPPDRRTGLPLPLLLAGIVGLVLVGCTNPRLVAYKSLAAVGESEAAAMKSAATLEVKGQITEAAWVKIAAAHDKFRPAYAAAIEVAQMDLTQPASATVIALAQEVLNLVALYVPKP